MGYDQTECSTTVIQNQQLHRVEPEPLTDVDRQRAVAGLIHQAAQNLAEVSGEHLMALAAEVMVPLEWADTPMRLRAMFDLAGIAVAIGRPHVAVAAARFAVRICERGNDLAARRRAHTSLGGVLQEAGDIVGAIEQHAFALECVAKGLGDPLHEVAVWSNLAVAYSYGTLYLKSIDACQRALAVIKRHNHLRWFESTVYPNLARAYLMMGRHEEGIASIQHVLNAPAPLDESPQQQVNRALMHSIAARLYCGAGRLDDARPHVAQALRIARSTRSPRARISAVAAHGRYLFARAKLRPASVLLSKGLRLSEKQPGMRLDVLVSLQAVFEAMDKRGDALRAIDALLADCGRAKSRSVHWLLGSGTHLNDEFEVALFTGPLERKAAEHRAAMLEAQRHKDQIEQLERLAVTAELRDDATGEHSYRVGALAALIATEMGLSAEYARDIDLAARLHDIGKIGIPDSILLSPDALSAEQRKVMQAHTTLGAELLSQGASPQLAMARDIALYHHERWDGQGYPSKLAGPEIPLAARIAAVSDVFDALTHRRPYKHAWPLGEAVDHITQGSGTQFDPEAVDAFLRVINRLSQSAQPIDEALASTLRQSSMYEARQRMQDALKLLQRREI